jgi:DNA polymerase I-like protein with 3'-5' exonuclease and polymerase domains
MDAARGHWPELLQALADVDPDLLTGEPAPCPVCGGDDRFTFDDKDGDGTWICRKCPHPEDKSAAAGDGMALLRNVTEWTFSQAAQSVEQRLERLGLPSRNGNGRPSSAVTPSLQGITASEASLEGRPIRLARLVNGPATDEEPVRQLYDYGPGLRTQRFGVGKGKKLIPYHQANGSWISAGGPNPWPAYGQADAIEAVKAAPGSFVLDIEGEKCAGIGRQGGAAAITQPGHAHRPAQIRARYRALKKEGAGGIACVPDRDEVGRRRAEQSRQAAEKEGLAFLLLPAEDIWPEIPAGGSIDDAPGTPAERVAAIEQALAERGDAVEWPAEETRTKAPKESHEQRLLTIRNRAAQLLQKGVRPTERIPLLRAFAGEQSILLRDTELQRILWDARRAARGQEGAVRPGEALNLSPTRWLWEGMLLVACLNLMVGLPKTGKTSLLVAMIAAWSKGAAEFLGMPLVGPCPPVLLVGVDMPENDWGPMLKEFGLMGEDAILRLPIVGLFHKGRPITLDPEGVEEIAGYAEANPGLLILLDSYTELTKRLGLKERDSDFAEPLSDLLEAVAPFGATLAGLHHSGKERAAGSASEASRGTTALPAISSQNINIYPAARGEDWDTDRKRILATEGRGGAPVKLLLERIDGTWISHGSPAALEQAMRAAKAEEGLTDRQANALELVRVRWADEGERTTSKLLAEHLRLDASTANRTLKQLEKKKLLQSATVSTEKAAENQFWPTGEEPHEGAQTPPGPLTREKPLKEVQAPSRVYPPELPEVPELSEPLEVQIAKALIFPTSNRGIPGEVHAVQAVQAPWASLRVRTREQPPMESSALASSSAPAAPDPELEKTLACICRLAENRWRGLRTTHPSYVVQQGLAPDEAVALQLLETLVLRRVLIRVTIDPPEFQPFSPGEEDPPADDPGEPPGPSAGDHPGEGLEHLGETGGPPVGVDPPDKASEPPGPGAAQSGDRAAHPGDGGPSAPTPSAPGEASSAAHPGDGGPSVPGEDAAAHLAQQGSLFGPLEGSDAIPVKPKRKPRAKKPPEPAPEPPPPPEPPEPRPYSGPALEGLRYITAAADLPDPASLPLRLGFDLETFNRRIDLHRHVASLFPAMGGEIRLAQLFDGNDTLVVDVGLIGAPAIDWLRTLTRDPNRTLVGHNLLFEASFLIAAGIRPLCRWWDTMLAVQMLGDLPESGLAAATQHYLGREIDKTEQTSDWGNDLSAEQLRYAALDAEIMWPLVEVLQRQLEATGQLKAFHLEMGMISACADGQVRGLAVDLDAIGPVAAAAKEALARVVGEICATLGIENPRSAKEQLHPALEKALGVPLTSRRKGKDGKFSDEASTDKATLKRFAGVPIVDQILEMRDLEATLKEIKWLKRDAGQADGRIHPSYRILGASTGRTTTSASLGEASKLRNVPNDAGLVFKTGEKAGQLRPMKIPAWGFNFQGLTARSKGALTTGDPDTVLLDLDWASIEVRLQASPVLYNDAGCRQEILGGLDSHAHMALTLFDLEGPADGVTKKEHVTPEQRHAAKPANFSLAYGCGITSLKAALSAAQGVPVSQDKAKAVYEAWHALHPQISQQMKLFEPKDIYETRTASGRRVRYPNRGAAAGSPDRFYPLSRTNGINYPIQGSGKDLLADAVGDLWVALDTYPGVRVVGLIHDEVLIECPRSMVEEVKEVALSVMTSARLQEAYLGDIPLEAEAKVGDSWGEAH